MQQQAANNNVNAAGAALQNLPNPTVLAQRMLANYDADASGELNQVELQAALEGLRQLIAQNMQAAQLTAAAQQNQQTVQNQMQNQMNFVGDRRPPPGGQGGRRGR
ncbi:MAG: hypothetical protein KDB00_03110 [Planctomycetales bacterium]|nr:hypothetical protein [Planctomycetales bacterium]